MPGVPKSRLEDVHVVFHRNERNGRLSLTITVNIPDPALSDHEESIADLDIPSCRTYGKCHFTYASSTNQLLLIPKYISQLERVLKDGVFRIKLPRKD